MLVSSIVPGAVCTISFLFARVWILDSSHDSDRQSAVNNKPNKISSDRVTMGDMAEAKTHKVAVLVVGDPNPPWLHQPWCRHLLTQLYRNTMTRLTTSKQSLSRCLHWALQISSSMYQPQGFVALTSTWLQDIWVLVWTSLDTKVLDALFSSDPQSIQAPCLSAPESE
jgi:hypothetical protein